MTELIVASNTSNEALDLLKARKVTFADPCVLQAMPGSSLRTVMIGSVFSPTKDPSESSLEVRLCCTYWQMEQWTVDGFGLPSRCFNIRRTEFEAATFRVLDDAEVLALTIEVLARRTPPFFHTLRDMIGKWGETERQARYEYWIVRAYEESGGDRRG